MKVALLESVPFPRFQVGESLHPGTEVLLHKLGVAQEILGEGFLRYAGIWTRIAGKRRFTAFGSDFRGTWMGFQVDRARFDTILLSRARRSGADFFSCRTQAVRRTPRGVLIGTDCGQLRCRVVVDATGSRRWVARQLKSKSIQCSPTIVARYGYREGEVPHLSECPVFRFRQSGWHWVARVGPDRYQWISASWGTDLSPSVPKEVELLRPVSRVRGADVTWRILYRAASPDFVAVGDAAATVDPASSRGILRALSSGIMAGYCIERILNVRSKANEIAQFYHDWIRRGFARDTDKLNQIYGPSIL